jgi:hypothetical protein
MIWRSDDVATTGDVVMWSSGDRISRSPIPDHEIAKSANHEIRQIARSRDHQIARSKYLEW